MYVYYGYSTRFLAECDHCAQCTADERNCKNQHETRTKFIFLGINEALMPLPLLLSFFINLPMQIVQSFLKMFIFELHVEAIGYSCLILMDLESNPYI